MDVGEWLRGLGLGQHETVFREHAIDMDVLADLTDAELAQIGVPLGDRKRLAKGLSTLENARARSPGRAGDRGDSALPPAPGAVEAERRQITRHRTFEGTGGAASRR